MIRTAIVFMLILVACSLMLFATVLSDPEAAEVPSPETLTPADIPEEVKNQANPFARDAQSSDRGKEIFSSQCTMCHGADGRGSGDLVERLALDMPDFTDPKMQAQWTDGDFFYVINTGPGHMPGQITRFKDETKWDLVNYVRTFAPGK